MDYEAWRCKNDDSLFCPEEGCAASYGCAREKGWLPGKPTPAGCDGRFPRCQASKAPPYSWCLHHEECIKAGRCTRDINCGD
jgi:hypothetical protein